MTRQAETFDIELGRHSRHTLKYRALRSYSIAVMWGGTDEAQPSPPFGPLSVASISSIQLRSTGSAGPRRSSARRSRRPPALAHSYCHQSRLEWQVNAYFRHASAPHPEGVEHSWTDFEPTTSISIRFIGRPIGAARKKPRRRCTPCSGRERSVPSG